MPILNSESVKVLLIKILMKITLTLTFTLLFTSGILYSQSNENYQAATWYNNKPSVITYTFDDYNNTGSKQLSDALPLFDAYNYKVTFYIITGSITDWTGLQQAALNGHEIASHTVSHTDLPTLSVSNQEEELSQSKTIIDSVIPGNQCLTIAYPYCDQGNTDLTPEYYIAGRVCSGQIVSSSPSNYYQISSIVCGSEGSVVTSTNLNDKVNSAYSSKGWCVFLFHGINMDGGYSNIQTRHLGAHLDYVNENDSCFWVSTFANTVKYIKERSAAVFTETELTSDSLQLTITDNLADSIYDQEITVLRTLPTGWTSAKVYINHKQVTSTVVEIDNDTCIQFNALPDYDEIYISKYGSYNTDLNTKSAGTGITVYPNPFNESLTLKMDGEFTYAIYTLSGELVEKGNGKEVTEIAKKLKNGTYLLQTQNSKGTQSQKIVKTR